MSHWVLRTYREGDEKFINAAFCSVFQTSRTLEEWRWKFSGQGLPPFIMLAVEEPRRVLAQYAAVPMRFATPAGEVLAGHVVDVFAVPETRSSLASGKPYLQALASFIETWCRPDQLALCYGFPSVRPLRLGQRVGPYAQVPDLPVYELIWKNPQAPRRIFWQTRTVWGLNPRAFAELWCETGARFAYAAVRDASYLRWRYLAHPRQTYGALTLFSGSGPQAALVFRLAQRTLALVDWAAPPEISIWEKLLTAALRGLGSENVEQVTAWLTGDEATVAALQELGFETRVRPDVRLLVHLFHPDLDPEAVPGRFYTTWGDTDLI